MITKHLQRVAEEKQKKTPPRHPRGAPAVDGRRGGVGRRAAAGPPRPSDAPARVTEKKGEADFAIRRVPRGSHGSLD